jgi:hypothetical protein
MRYGAVLRDVLTVELTLYCSNLDGSQVHEFILDHKK